jgi:hypothetical protein
MDTKRNKNGLNKRQMEKTSNAPGIGTGRGKGILYRNEQTPFRCYIAELLQDDYQVSTNHDRRTNQQESSPPHSSRRPKLVYREPRQVTKICIRCKKPFTVPAAHQDRRKHCSVLCCTLDRRLFEVTTEELYALVWSRPTTEVARLFGVSDKAIEKRCKRLGIPKPPRGYWLQIYRERQHAQR